MKKNKIQSFSLIEVLVFVSILSIFFVAAASVTVVSLRNMKINEHKILATHYAEELLGWLRNEKETDWNAFVPNSNKTYCFYVTPISDWGGLGSCAEDDKLAVIFKRELVLSHVGGSPTQINVKITVSWSDTGTTYSVPLSTVLTVWE